MLYKYVCIFKYFPIQILFVSYSYNFFDTNIFGYWFVSFFWYEYIRIFVRIVFFIRIYSDIRLYRKFIFVTPWSGRLVMQIQFHRNSLFRLKIGIFSIFPCQRIPVMVIEPQKEFQNRNANILFYHTDQIQKLAKLKSRNVFFVRDIMAEPYIKKLEV